MSRAPEAGQVWEIVDDQARYEILALGQQKEADGKWYPAVFYRAELDHGIYSRRAESFQARFTFTGETRWTAGK